MLFEKIRAIPYFYYSVKQSGSIWKIGESTQKSRKCLVAVKLYAYQEFFKVRTLQYGKEMSDGNIISNKSKISKLQLMWETNRKLLLLFFTIGNWKQKLGTIK